MSVDDKVISASLETTQFSRGAADILKQLQKINETLAQVGKTNGLDAIEKSANKVTFGGLSSAIDKIKGKFTFREADQGFSEIDKAANKVTLDGVGNAIDKTKGKFNFPEADAAFSGIEKSSAKVTFQGLGAAIDSISSKFSVVEGAASVAFGNIAYKAIAAGTQAAKGLSISPVTGGLQEYETQLNAVQTILSNTAAAGTKLKDVNAALNELNHYADLTIYNFTEMTRNIGTFTAAGVDLKTATASIKGIANLAALSGSNSAQASTAMYQLSQAISSGRVSLQDWNSVVNAGMGGTVFQRALTQTAEHLGTIKKGAVELKGPMKNVSIEGKSFRESITAKPGEQSWLTSKVLTDTLKQLSGDMTTAQLKAEGYSDAQIKAIRTQAKMAVNAATQVKTLSGVLDTAKEALGSGWAQTWQLVFGDFGQAKKLFTGMSNAINGMISDSANARNALLKDWAKLGGRKALIEGIKNIFVALGSVLKPIKEAFRDIFPPTTGAQLADLSKRFESFTEKLKIGPETAENLKRTFAGFFAVLDIGKQVVEGIFHVIGRLFSSASDGSGGFLDLTGNIGDFVVSVDDAIKKGSGLTDFFDGVADVLTKPISMLGKLAGLLNGLFDGFDKSGADGVQGSLKGLNNSLSPLQQAVKVAKGAWSGFMHLLDAAQSQIGPLLDGIASAFDGFGGAVADALQNADFSSVFKIVETTLLGGIFLALKRGFSKGVSVDLGGGLTKSLSSTFDALTHSLTTMQTNVKADTLLKIGAALALLAAGVVALSFIDPKKLASAMTATAVGLGQLIGAMALLSKVGGIGAFATMPVIAASLIGLAIAVDILAVAVVIFSKLSWTEIEKGLVGVGGALTAIGIGTKLIGPSITLAGPGILAVAIAMNILAGAMKIFATMKWGEIAKGMAGVAGGLTAIGIGTKLMGPSILLIGPGLIAVGIALGLLAGAMEIFGSMDMKTIGKGLLGIGGSLLVIGLAMQAIPPTVALQAAGLVLVGVALTGIAAAIRLLGGMSVASLAKGIIAMGASLVVLAAGLTLMSGTLAGSVALLAAASALAILVPVLALLGSMSWGTIAKGLGAIAASLAVIGVVGAAASPGLIAVGVGLVAIGAGVTLIGAGVYLISSALVKLGSDGLKGIAAVLAAFTVFVAAMPKIVIDFIKGVVSIAESIASLAPRIVSALVVIIGQLTSFVIQSAPKMGQAFTAIILAALGVINNSFPEFVQTGLGMLQALLSGIRGSIGKITTQVSDIVVRFLGALTGKLGQLTTAGTNMLVALMRGVANNIPRLARSAADVMTSFLSGISSNISKVTKAAGDIMVRFIAGIATAIPNAVSQGGKVIAGLVRGIASAAGSLVTAAGSAAGKFINALATAMLKLVDTGAKAIIRFMNGIATAIRQYEPQMLAAGANIGAAIVQGLVNGIANLAGTAIAKAKELGDKVLHALGKAVHLGSPSKETYKYGGWIVEGLANGMNDNVMLAVASASKVGKATTDEFAKIKSMHDIGQQVGQQFAEGLKGSADDISGAFTDLNNKVTDAMTTLRTTIASENDNLKKLRDARKPDQDAIDKAEETLKKNKDALAALVTTHTYLGTALTKEQTLFEGHVVTLTALAKQMDSVNTQLETANQNLDDAIKKRDDAKKAFSDQFSTLPNIEMVDKDGNPIDPATQVANWMQALQNQSTAVSTYSDTLQQLRTLGLDDATYQKLLQDGTADQAFASQLLAGGKTAVAGLNSLDGQLQSVSETLATRASTNLYKAGVDSAQGLVDGLNSKKSAITKAMEAIATAMIKAIKKKLHIKSPSRAFAEVGKFSSLGVAAGLKASSKVVTDAAESVGNDALSAMQKSMSQMSLALADGIDSNPTITPVLDLTQLQKDAKQLSDLSNVVPITAATSYGSAAAITQAQHDRADGSTADALEGPLLRFEQNNYSPEALSDVEIYRKTKNLLSQAKDALAAGK